MSTISQKVKCTGTFLSKRLCFGIVLFGGFEVGCVFKSILKLIPQNKGKTFHSMPPLVHLFFLQIGKLIWVNLCLLFKSILKLISPNKGNIHILPPFIFTHFYNYFILILVNLILFSCLTNDKLVAGNANVSEKSYRVEAKQLPSNFLGASNHLFNVFGSSYINIACYSIVSFLPV